MPVGPRLTETPRRLSAGGGLTWLADALPVPTPLDWGLRSGSDPLVPGLPLYRRLHRTYPCVSEHQSCFCLVFRCVKAGRGRLL